MKKKVFYYLLRMICLSFVLIITVTLNTMAAEVNWLFVAAHPATDKANVLYREFVDEIFKESNGRFKITLHYPGELPYKNPDFIKATAENKIQMAYSAVGFLGGDVPELNVFGMPFLCTSFESFFKAMESVKPIFEEDLVKRFKVSVLSNWVYPPQNIWTSKQINVPSDLKGLKIRAWNPDQVRMYRILEVTPVSITADELPLALQRKIIDGITTSALSVYDWKLYEYLKYGLMINLSVAHMATFVNSEEFDKLPKDFQQLLRRKSSEYDAKSRKTSPEIENDARKNLKEKGMIFNEFTTSQNKKVRDMMRPMWEEWASKNGPVAQKLLSEITKIVGE